MNKILATSAVVALIGTNLTEVQGLITSYRSLDGLDKVNEAFDAINSSSTLQNNLSETVAQFAVNAYERLDAIDSIKSSATIEVNTTKQSIKLEAVTLNSDITSFTNSINEVQDTIKTVDISTEKTVEQLRAMHSVNKQTIVSNAESDREFELQKAQQELITKYARYSFDDIISAPVKLEVINLEIQAEADKQIKKLTAEADADIKKLNSQHKSNISSLEATNVIELADVENILKDAISRRENVENELQALKEQYITLTQAGV